MPFNSLKPLHRYAILNPGNSVEGIIMKINWYQIASAGGDIRPWVITVTLAVVLVVFGTTGVTKGSPYDDK